VNNKLFKNFPKKLINFSAEIFLSRDEYQSFMLKKKFFHLAFPSSGKRNFRVQIFCFD